MNAVVKHEEQALSTVSDSTSILAVISRAASDPNVDIDKFERLMAMQERITAAQSESAFNDAMSDAQANMRPISADAVNPQTHSNYATYGKLDKALRPIYTNNGFALSFDTGKDAPADFVRVLCYVSHKAGHSRTYHVDMPADGKGAKGGDVMTKTHAVGSGMSYGMRYLLKMIFNVAIGEDDDDGNAAGDNGAIADWISAIEATDTLESLEKLGKELAVSAVSARDRKAIKPAYAKRHKELKA